MDFDWPLGEAWKGFLFPERLCGVPCPDCERGYSPHAERLYKLWNGHVPFRPRDNGSTPLTPATPAVREFAERNIARSPEFYGSGVFAVSREATRLAILWNGMWCHHLNQDDVDALLEADRLWDFTRPRPAKGGRRQDIEPPPTPTAEQVNEWSLRGFGHDAINAHIVIQARCEREDAAVACPNCEGETATEAYPGQRAEAEAWKPTEPPTGEGWQLWGTVSEGSPISPVVPTAEKLVDWMSDPERGDAWLPPPVAARFVADGWAPSFVFTPETGLVSGTEYVGTREDA
jgi:hypothetical protein